MEPVKRYSLRQPHTLSLSHTHAREVGRAERVTDNGTYVVKVKQSTNGGHAAGKRRERLGPLGGR